MSCESEYWPKFQKHLEEFDDELKERIKRLAEEICANPPMGDGKITKGKNIWYRHFRRTHDIVYRYNECHIDFLLIRKR